MITVSIEASDTHDAEEQILAMADGIRLRRTLVAEGCTCDLRTQVYPLSWPRCTSRIVVCDARKAKITKAGALNIAEAGAQFVRLDGNGTPPSAS